VLQKFLAGVDVWRRQDPVDVGCGVLKEKKGRNNVRGKRQNTVRKKGQEGDWERVDDYQRPAVFSVIEAARRL
jgi:hypothetical protein